MISTLMFFTLIIMLVIAAWGLMRFIRKPQNRHSMDGNRERNIDEIRRDSPAEADRHH